MRKKWFAASIICKGDGADLRLLLQKSVHVSPRYRSKVGFPGGMRGRSDNTVERTALRETREETHLRLKMGVHPEAKLDMVDRGQIKVFLLFRDSDFQGDLRKERVLDGDAWLLPPFWATIEQAKNLLCRAHQQGLAFTQKHFGLMG